MSFESGVNNIYLITNNKLCNKLTIDLVKKWNIEKGNSKLMIIDLDKNTTTTIEKFKNVQVVSDENNIQNIIQKYEIYSYPTILVLRNNRVIEHIFGNYKNILEIVNFYL